MELQIAKNGQHMQCQKRLPNHSFIKPMHAYGVFLLWQELSEEAHLFVILLGVVASLVFGIGCRSAVLAQWQLCCSTHWISFLVKLENCQLWGCPQLATLQIGNFNIGSASKQPEEGDCKCKHGLENGDCLAWASALSVGFHCPQHPKGHAVPKNCLWF